jgi:hypothetical protein
VVGCEVHVVCEPLTGNGSTSNYGINYGYDDAFWSYGGKFYRTNTNNGNILCSRIRPCSKRSSIVK